MTIFSARNNGKKTTARPRPAQTYQRYWWARLEGGVSTPAEGRCCAIAHIIDHGDGQTRDRIWWTSNTILDKLQEGDALVVHQDTNRGRTFWRVKPFEEQPEEVRQLLQQRIDRHALPVPDLDFEFTQEEANGAGEDDGYGNLQTGEHDADVLEYVSIFEQLKSLMPSKDARILSSATATVFIQRHKRED